MKKVLVVDDSETVRNQVGRALSDAGFEVADIARHQHAENGGAGNVGSSETSTRDPGHTCLGADDGNAGIDDSARQAERRSGLDHQACRNEALGVSHRQFFWGCP